MTPIEELSSLIQECQEWLTPVLKEELIRIDQELKDLAARGVYIDSSDLDCLDGEEY